MRWYVRRGECEIGPLGEDALRALVGTGQITDDTQLWREGLSGWTEARALPGVLGPRASISAAAATSSSTAAVAPRTPAPSAGAKRRIWLAAGICLAGMTAVISFGMQQRHDETREVATDTPTSILRQELTQAANSVNARSPRMIDKITRLDGAHSGPGPLFTYEYTLTNISARLLTPKSLDTVRWRLSADVGQAVCGGSGLQPVLRAGVITRIHYRDRDGQDLVMVRVSSADCGK